MPPVPIAVVALVPVGVGLMVLRRRRLVGSLLVAHGVSVGLLLGLDGRVSGRPGAVLDQLLAGAWVGLFLWLVVVVHLLPDGRCASAAGRWWIRSGLVGALLLVVGAAGDASSYAAAHDGDALPVPWLPETASAVIGSIGFVLVVALAFGSPVAVARRFRSSGPDERQQLLWLCWGALGVPVALLVGWTSHFLLDDAATVVFYVALAVSATALPAAIGVGVLRHQLFDIQLVLSRTLTYLTLTGLVLGLYVGLLSAAGALLGSRSVGGAVAVVVVAVAVHPVYLWVRRRVDRWVNGLRAEPHAALRLLAARAEEADPDGLVDAVTAAVATAFRARRAYVGPAGSGVPLLHRGEHLGDLAVELAPGDSLSAADAALLDDLARYAAVLVHAESLNVALRDSRSRLLSGVEEERRRLRRDLHDGLGPTLAGVVLTLGALQGRVDERERGALVGEVRSQVQDAITEIRRIVDDLRPPAVDEVGLVQALRQRAAALSGPVTFEVLGPEGEVRLPAAVEVAVYRIAGEAMTNVVRHSGATRCRVWLEVSDTCVVTVSDNGRGADLDGPGGVGRSSMEERATDLGGRCTIGNGPGGGVVVRAELPLRTETTMRVVS